MTKQQYIEYLVATPGNYTCTHLANHLEGEAATSHDTISDYLRREKLTPRRLWEAVQPLLHDSAQSYLVVDDSVQNKQYSQKIKLVKIRKRSSWSSFSIAELKVVWCAALEWSTFSTPAGKQVTSSRLTSVSILLRQMARPRTNTF